MKLCLTCRALSKGGALFCARCGRSFGAPRCRRGHPNASGAAFCQVCGVPGLSLPTRFIPLGFVPLGFVPLGIGALLILGGLWGALHFVWPWIAGTLAGRWSSTRWPSPIVVLDRVMAALVTWGLLLFLASLFLPAAFKRALRHFIGSIGRGLWRLLWRSPRHRGHH